MDDFLDAAQVLSEENDAYIEHLKDLVADLEKKLNYQSGRLTYSAIKGNDKLIEFFTGLPNADVFEALLGFCSNFEINYYFEWKVDILKLEDQLLLALMKFRQGYKNVDLAQRFNVSETTVRNVILTWLHVLHEILFEKMMQKIPSRLKNQSSLPSSFAVFTNTRIVVDCSDVKAATPSNMHEQNLTWSAYKEMTSMKGGVGVAPNGTITWVSELYPGSVSDKEIVKDSNLLDQMESGDMMMADKGFLIHDILPQGVSLNIPPFLTHGQFTPDEVQMTLSIARARVHVERAIARIKGFRILNFIPSTMRAYASKIWQTCAALVNLQNPLIREVYDDLQ